ncbi:kinase-like protein [Trametes coccinea BRFM310]|uniref:Kinase-like protein n=1 Tax=Trametes coccinea (strain BRFM310) TaxID=1353009 RepID=A0A1Y2IA85_TRAC3|nr:kinase-like protein [Trametes coccinea BRFM310]
MNAGTTNASVARPPGHAPKDSSLDPDQKISQELISFSPPAALAISEPEPLPSSSRQSPVASPLSYHQFSEPEPDLSSSPAALFLSAFSPSTSERFLAPDDEGSVIAGYTLGPIVGHGGFSIIRTASSAQGGTVAVKIVRRSDLDKQPDPALARKSLEREAAVWASLNHEHILPLFTVNHTPYAEFFVTLYCPAGSLFDILKRDGRPALPQDDAGMMFRQVVRGLRYMHEVAGYVHGDLKLENVLVDEMGVCKIADFGMARKIGEIDDDLESEEDEDRGTATPPDGLHRSRTTSQGPTYAHRSLGKQAGHPALLHLKRRHHGPRHRNSSPYPATGSSSPAIPNRAFAPGSLPYAAPELLLPPNNAASYAANPAQDIWALGVMLFALLTGKLPFSDPFEPRLQMKILHGVFDMPQGIGRSGEQVLSGCIERSVAKRWTIAMVDEVAWGIGWGSAADDVTPPPEAALSCRASRSPSRSRALSRKDNAVDDAGINRSSSRAARSTSRSTSAVRTSSRSKSRASRPYDPHFPHPLLQTERHPAHPLPTQPSLTSLTDAILRTTSSSSSDSTSTQDSAIVLQPSHSSESDVEREAERGRLLRPRLQADVSLSRSRSPPDSPATPKDQSLDSMMRRRKSPPSRPILGSPELEHPVSELDTLDEDSRWTLSPSLDEDGSGPRSLSRDADRDSSVSRSPSARRGRDNKRAFSRSRDELRRLMRNESMPPSPSPSNSWTHSSMRDQGWYSSGQNSVAPAATPMPIPISGSAPGARSKSLGPDRSRHLYRPLISTARLGN